MTKLLLVLLIGLVFESTGVVLLKKGMNQIGDVKQISAAEVARVVRSGATNANILLGVFFEALFFACLLILMSKSEISFLWPLTGLSFVFATFAADGPTRCSGLDVCRYDPQSLHRELGGAFELRSHVQEDHRTPAGRGQRFP